MSGAAAARFDQAKLDSVNAHYIRAADDIRLVALVAERLEKEFGGPCPRSQRERLLKAMPGLKPRAKTIVELAREGPLLCRAAADPARRRRRQGPDRRRPANGSRALGAALAPLGETEWTAPVLEAELRRFAESGGLKLGAIAQPLRAALTGSLASPGIFEVMEVLGREESLARIEDAAHA